MSDFKISRCLIINVTVKREQRMNDAFKKYPERFRNGMPKISGMPTNVWINKPEYE